MRCFTGRCASLAAPRLPHASPARSPLPLELFLESHFVGFRASLDTNEEIILLCNLKNCPRDS